jgi:very-short-patch-repair endonuclease
MTLQRARELRGTTTHAERLLWWFLRSLKHEGIHFRRQAPFGRYTVDFVCHSAKLIVELDGSQHGEEKTFSTTQNAPRSSNLAVIA